jgi:hypothetical protein
MQLFKLIKMKKIFIILFVLISYIGHSQALEPKTIVVNGAVINVKTTSQIQAIAVAPEGYIQYSSDTQTIWIKTATVWKDTGIDYDDTAIQAEVDLNTAKVTNTDNQTLAQVLSQGNDANGFPITNLADPTIDQDAATKGYVDSNDDDSQNLSLAGNTLNISNGTGVDLTPILGSTLTDAEISQAFLNVNPNPDLNASDDLIEGTNTITQDVKVQNSDGAGLRITTNGGGATNISGGLFPSDRTELIVSSNSIEALGYSNADITQLGPRAVLTRGYGDANYLGTGTDNQNLSRTGNTINISGGTGVDLTPILGGGGGTPNDNSVTTAKILDGTIDELDLDASINTSLDLADTALQSFTEVDGSVTNEIQNASQVPFTPTGNTVATNTQAAIEELQTEINGISGGGSTPERSIIELANNAVITSAFSSNQINGLQDLVNSSTTNKRFPITNSSADTKQKYFLNDDNSVGGTTIAYEGSGMTFKGRDATGALKGSNNAVLITSESGAHGQELSNGNLTWEGAYTWTLVDLIAPALVSAVIENAAPSTVVVTYNEPLDITSVPNTTSFTINVNPVTNVSLSGNVATLTLTNPINNGDVVTLGYSSGGGGNPIQDLSGNSSGSISSFPVTNNVASGETLGTELVTNGNFDTDSDWVLRNNSIISGGIATIMASGSVGISGANHTINQDVLDVYNGLEKDYRITIEVRQTVGTGNLQLGLGFSDIATFAVTNSFVSYSIDLLNYTNGGAGQQHRFSIAGVTASDEFEVTSVSIKEILP